jgi:hypothetical protein
MTVMTKELAPQGDSYGPDEGLDYERDHPFFADPAEVTAENYPSLRNVSVGFIFNRVARPLEPAFCAIFAETACVGRTRTSLAVRLGILPSTSGQGMLKIGGCFRDLYGISAR